MPVLLVRALWLGVFALFLLSGRTEQIVALIAATVFGGLGHLGLVLFLRNRRRDRQWARKVTL